jgi:signal transduction histidine kinase/CheY-like chemotaxis protein
MLEADALDRASELERENGKLRKINAALMERIERASDGGGGSFALFQRAILLEKIVRERTEELRAVNTALQEAKLDAERANLGKTKFLAAAGHDLLQPLHAARLFVGALTDSGVEARTREIALRVDAALSDAEHLLSTTLEISKLDAGVLTAELTDFPIGPFLQRLAGESAPQAEQRGLRFRIVTGEAVVHTDPLLLARIVRNFISNAIRYTQRGGIVLGCRLRAGVCRIEVWDTGIGIPADRLTEVFEEFRQLGATGGDREGMGLGLAVVDRISGLLGVPIEVKSRLGRGSVFSVSVPLGDPRALSQSAEPVRAAEIASRLDGKIGLVIDDDRASREAMALLLRTWGCKIVEADGASAARAALNGPGPAPDFIVADYHLKNGETGLDAIGSMRGTSNRIPAVVVTNDTSDATRSLVTACGYPLLAKPVRPDRLRSLVNHWFL